MKLEDLRAYYRMREYQISHLINARKMHKLGSHGEQQTFMFLLFWADAMYEADLMMFKMTNSNVVMQSRGKL